MTEGSLSQTPEVINIDNDDEIDEDKDLKLALLRSLQDESPTVSTQSKQFFYAFSFNSYLNEKYQSHFHPPFWKIMNIVIVNEIFHPSVIFHFSSNSISYPTGEECSKQFGRRTN